MYALCQFEQKKDGLPKVIPKVQAEEVLGILKLLTILFLSHSNVTMTIVHFSIELQVQFHSISMICLSQLF